MGNNDNRVHQIISYLANMANAAADGVSDVVHEAGSAMNGAFDDVKRSFELNNLRDEQSRCFTEIGRILFFIKNNGQGDAHPNDTSDSEEYKAIDHLLEQAAQLQEKIEAAETSKKKADPQLVICPNCSTECKASFKYCPECGQFLPTSPDDHQCARDKADEGDPKDGN